MTSEVNTVKTNDFLRRRKLRLQQVREQSKDIAKKIRQRAKTEELRQVVELDAKKQQEYFQKQEKLVKHLEELYNRGIQNVGAGHKNANKLKCQDEQTDKVDLSKQRGKEAAAELRRKRQETLDEQKKILDRKLQARDAANEISREKSAIVANKVLSKTSSTKVEDSQSKKDTNSIKDSKENEENVTCNDMATQWEVDEMPNEWEPIPTLSLPKDDNISVKEFNNNECKSDKSKRLDLFALSEEMPSSLRGTLTNEERVPVRPSVTLVSEYLQSRGMRLRETDSVSSKKTSDELQSLRQTIMKTRTSREGSNVCHVHDIEMVPVPSWQAGVNCGYCHTLQHKHCHIDKIASNYQISRVKPARERDISPTPILRGSSPFRRNKVCLRSFSAKGPHQQPSKTSEVDSFTAKKKNSVTMYNHTTRDTRDIIYEDNRHVVRDLPNNEDAYSQAMKESTSDEKTEKDLKKLQDIRSKVAMTKQSVEKEYRETMSFLNSLPKNTGNKPIRNAYMDEHRQEMQRENRQRKMQQEYKNIAKECKKHACRNKSRNQSKSPVKDNFEMDFQYSWMPVPESDGNLAIHTIPTSVKEGKSNSVKFSKVDSYHEYRSRHKHTPPTKDTTDRPKHQNTSESDSTESDSTSEITLEEKKHKRLDLSDAERIVIYKILDSKKDRKTRKKLVKEIAQSLTMVDKSNVDENSSAKKSRTANSDVENKVTFEQVDEGVYKTVNQNGDNIASMYFRDREGTEIELTQEEMQYGKKCQCGKRTSEDQQRDQSVDPLQKIPQWESGDNPPLRKPNTCVECRCGCATQKLKPATPKSRPIYTIHSNQVLPSTATSTSSFRTATTDKANAASDGGYIKLLDEGGQDTGKFYIGASGLLKDDAYEVVIRLRKKGDERKDDSETNNEKVSKVSKNVTQSAIPEASTTVENTQPSLEKVPKERREIGIQNDSIAPQVPSDETPKATIEVKDATSEILVNKNLDPITTAVGTDDNENVVTKSQELKTVAEKGVSTSFQDSFAVLQNISRTDSAPRPATSAYTQTSMSSPSHRPVFFHMSSSTSTAYMSPPDMILPKFLKQGYRLTDEEINDPRNYPRDSSIEDNVEEAQYCKYDRSCRKCTKAKGDPNEIDSRKRKVCKIMRAPPNTARRTKDSDRSDNERGSATSFKKKRKDKCRKCESRSSHDGVKSRSSKRNIPVSKHSSRNLNVVSSNASSRANKLKLTKSNINPVVKKYVNKLLSLNRESLKAVEVMDQDCSTVPTPGSSIINDNNNVDSNKNIEQKISLEQIKDILKQQILKECMDRCNKNMASTNKNDASSSCNFSDTCLRTNSNKNVKGKTSRKKVHKVKSLNISKHLLKIKRSDSDSQQRTKPTSSSSSPKENDKEPIQIPSKTKTRSSSSPTPRSKEINARKSATEVEKIKSASSLSRHNTETKVSSTNTERKSIRRPYSVPSSYFIHRAVTTSDSDFSAPQERKQDSLTNISTQTSYQPDSELNFVKLAESKIQNMEKIADLTEKCTKRLSNLAKVLDEVRKNKSLAYSHMSSSGNSSDSEQKTDKKTNKLQQYYDKQKLTAPETTDSQSENKNKENKDTSGSTNYIPYLSDIPKPAAFKNLNTSQLSESSSGSPNKSASPPLIADQHDYIVKNRARPPPALSRIHLKNGQDYIIPHELSTVIEVDSPLSVKLRNQGSRHDLNLPDINNTLEQKTTKIKETNASQNRQVDATDANANLLTDDCSSIDLLNLQKRAATESSDESKIQMIELRQFNEIMLKPFFSIQEYAKRFNIETLDDGSNLDDIPKDDVVNDEVSSLHSDASLPDVISELLKRNLITEPFKFDTGSNVNSTTMSSESTLSVLALSRAKKEKKKSSVMFQNKENIGETSDTLSMSSNPDLENAFKKLGMGWASSTLKKTKERLALSSSSNTSSSSLSQFKMKSFSQDIPAIVTDTVSSVANVSKPQQRRNTDDTPRNAEQQTSLTNTMTVKEFLTKELAKKITFDNKSKNEASEEFVSLFETKLPEEMQQSRVVREENSIENSVRSGNNRARTSTPVQLYKSMAYHSSSSSNISNGLFSNADDLSSVKVTSNSMKHSTSDKDDLTIPNFSLKMKRGSSECSKSD